MAIDEAKLAEHRENRKKIVQERKEKERAEQPPKVNKLVVEKLPEGLYYLRFSEGGPVPNELQGQFTSMSRIRTLVVKRYGSEDILCL
jgi:hypothetical protein